MCGIVGLIKKQELTEQECTHVKQASERLSKRGPDAQGLKVFKRAALGHRRLSILDTSEAAHQPFSDSSGRYTIVFNGEIFNFRKLREELQKEGFQFRTEGDTEVLLYAYIRYGTAFLNKLNGFFALAIYDSEERTSLLARDRFGIKPLLICNTENAFYFASEMKAMDCFRIAKELDHSSIYTYLQLNYIPEPHSIFKNVKKLEPGHYLKIDAENKVQKIPFYQLNYPPEQEVYANLSYEQAQEKFIELMEASVERRMVSDVPLGTFLSGGIDSSLITALASRYNSRLSTFSIGFRDDPHFDETAYALEVAKMYKTDHHVFSLGRNDLLESLYETLDYIDEPFADSSALAVNALSKETVKHVKVALSGDGADELFGGYHKHRGEYLMRQEGLKQSLVKKMKPLWEMLPKSRNNNLGNLFRKLHKFSEGANLSKTDRYWLWAGLMNEADASNLMLKKANPEIYLKRKEQILARIHTGNDFNDVLYTDLKLVLPGDMLRKTDLMSMAHGLEVRTPFLDHHLVNFAFSLSADFKINAEMKKRIVQDAARKLLPASLYNRPKQGFEVPLLDWFNNELHDLIHSDLLSDAFIREQNLFNPFYVDSLKNQLKSANPSDSQGNIWGLLVFNSWWKRYIA
jgi:asparagine synthase (glutamine-hydrolysing)